MLGADSAYLGRYGFVEAPFHDSPDGRFVYRSASLTRSTDAVLNRIARGDALIVVTGDPGIGKTTLCMELSLHIAPKAGADRGSRITVIDDADLLDVERLRELLSANTQSGERKQTVLVGQAQFEESLGRTGCVELEAIPRVQLGPLEACEINDYIERRMWVARGGIASVRESIADGLPENAQQFVSPPRFSARAIRRLARACEGNPRAVNVMCAQALELAADSRATTIQAYMIGRAAVPLVSVPRLAWGTTGVALAALAMATSIYSKGSSAGRADMRQTRSAIARSDESFDEFRRRTLRHAAELAAVPDVNELLRVRDDVLSRARTSDDRQRAVKDLLTEIDRITNEARARQLDVDRRQMLEYVKHR